MKNTRLVLALALGAFAIGCSGGDESSGDNPPPKGTTSVTSPSGATVKAKSGGLRELPPLNR